MLDYWRLENEGQARRPRGRGASGAWMSDVAAELDPHGMYDHPPHGNGLVQPRGGVLAVNAEDVRHPPEGVDEYRHGLWQRVNAASVAAFSAVGHGIIDDVEMPGGGRTRTSRGAITARATRSYTIETEARNKDALDDEVTRGCADPSIRRRDFTASFTSTLRPSGNQKS